ncbi:putative chromatin regulator PHD family [Helianthus annuus]|nr:putative chromatin regulator PHD family [Helianthus annuus]
MAMSFYKCVNDQCKFLLHQCCTRLPTELKGHQSHYGSLYYEHHTLILLPKVGLGFKCGLCKERCNGFAYNCQTCNLLIDVWCALTPRAITHKSHPYHIFGRLRKRSDKDYCRVCLSGFTYPEEISYSCALCNFHLHPRCALLLPETTRHRYDKHPMTLTYLPVENHEGDYFCEVCEEELNPNAAFYHCHECIQSMHTACAMLIPQRKEHIHGLQVKGQDENNHFYGYRLNYFCAVVAESPQIISKFPVVQRYQ